MLVVPSECYEGFPNVVGEAMACGVPVVATDVGATGWLVGDTGFLVPPRDPVTLAQHCVDLLALEPRVRQTWGMRARQRVVNQFSIASVVAQFTSLLEAVS